MRIALVYDALFPYVKGGGERRYYELARRLADHHQVSLVSFGWWRDQPPALALPNVTYTSVGRPMPLYTRDGKRSIAEALRFGAAVGPLLARERYDVVDCCAFPYFSVLAARLATGLKRTPLVVTWLEYWGAYWRSYLGWKGTLARGIEDAALLASPRIISVSAATTARLRQNLLHSGPAPVSVVPGGIDFEEIHGAPQLPEESDVIYVGRLLEHKRVDLLIRAMDALRARGTRLRCVIVGDGPERERLERLSADLGLDGAVRFLGFVPTESVYGLLKASKVFVFPSMREGFGIAVLEANACGLPAVVVRAPDNASVELVREGVTGRTCDPRPAALADAVAALLDERSATMRDDCEAFARRFDWSNVATAAVEVYEATAAGRPMPAGYAL